MRAVADGVVGHEPDPVGAGVEAAHVDAMAVASLRGVEVEGPRELPAPADGALDAGDDRRTLAHAHVQVRACDAAARRGLGAHPPGANACPSDHRAYGVARRECHHGDLPGHGRVHAAAVGEDAGLGEAVREREARRMSDPRGLARVGVEALGLTGVGADRVVAGRAEPLPDDRVPGGDAQVVRAKEVVADLDLARAVAGVPERRGRDGDQRGEERGGSCQASQATQSRVAQKAFEALLQ